jgi:ERCC4-type nuclease
MPSICGETDRIDARATLPALRSLGRLADLRPVIVADSREQEPLTFTRLQSVRGTLYSGDYSVQGLESKFAVERKSIDDLVSCCVNSSRERFERELHRLRGYQFKRLLVIGSREDIAAGRYHSRILPKAVLATLDTFEIRYSTPLVFYPSPLEAALAIERWVWRFAREVVVDANNLWRASV